MRPTALLSLLALAVASPAAAQGIVLPVRCGGACPARPLVLDSVRVFASLNEHGIASTYVSHVIRNASSDSVEGAFFFPIPEGAEVDQVMVHLGQDILLYGEWTRPEEARLLLDGLARERPRAGLAAYRGRRVIHVRVPAIPPGGVRQLRIGYSQRVPTDGRPITWRYPLSLGAAASPIGHLQLGMEVSTRSGFTDLRSPTHHVDVQWGTEMGRCPPQSRCGYMSVPSRRVKVVRLEPSADARRRDFELVYVLAPPGTVRPVLEEP
ncbi:MAG: VIT domain-containing protein [Longimicrobiaceae bacterium]